MSSGYTAAMFSNRSVMEHYKTSPVLRMAFVRRSAYRGAGHCGTLVAKSRRPAPQQH